MKKRQAEAPADFHLCVCLALSPQGVMTFENTKCFMQLDASGKGAWVGADRNAHIRTGPPNFACRLAGVADYLALHLQTPVQRLSQV